MIICSRTRTTKFIQYLLFSNFLYYIKLIVSCNISDEKICLLTITHFHLWNRRVKISRLEQTRSFYVHFTSAGCALDMKASIIHPRTFRIPSRNKPMLKASKRNDTKQWEILEIGEGPENEFAYIADGPHVCFEGLHVSRVKFISHVQYE